LLIAAETYFTDVRGFRPLAMEIIVSLDNESSSVLTTQYVAPAQGDDRRRPE
jgi:hypothetical protein